jgi:photosystem II stability/assembly factor-like uncharacterized protein
VLLPALDRTIDLDPFEFGTPLSARPAALDEQADRIYFSVAPSRTIVLDANTLSSVGEIPFGGELRVDAGRQRLYIGVPGDYAYSPDGTMAITPAELKLIDTSNLAVLRSAIYSDTSTLAPQVAVDTGRNTVYVTQHGVILVDAETLEVQGALSGTFPALPESSQVAVDAAILAEPRRLFVSLNNGIPGSNNGNTLAVYDLATGQVIAQDPERSLDGFAIDEAHDAVYAPRSNSSTVATVKYDAQGRALARVDGTGGAVLVDPVQNRVYLFQWRDRSSLKVFDGDLNFLGAVSFPVITTPQALLLDPERDRILVLQNGGRLAVIAGQGQPLDAIETTTTPDRYGVQAILPQSDQALLAIFASNEFVTQQGSVFRSDDGGATWEFGAGLPDNVVTDLKVTDSTIFAAAGGNGTTDGYGIWRSDDGGTTWRPVSHGLSDLGVTRLAVSPDFARDGTLYAMSKRGVLRSTDRGETWTSLADRYAPLLKELTVNFNSIALSPGFAQDNTLLIGHTGGLWRSTDRGETWTKIAGGPAANRLAYAPDGSIVLAINYDGVHRSDDGGLSWRSFNDGLDPSNTTIGDVQITDREAVVLVTRFDQPGVLYRLPLNEAAWQPVSLEADVSAFAVRPAGALLFGTSDGLVQRVK